MQEIANDTLSETESITLFVPHVLVVSSELKRVLDILQILSESNYQVSFLPLDETTDLSGILHRTSLIILEISRADEELALKVCQATRLSDTSFVPMIFLSENDAMVFRAMSLETGADAHLHLPVDPLEILRAVKAFARVKSLQDEVVRKSQQLSDLNYRMQMIMDSTDQELILARKIQASFLPKTFPQRAGISFGAITAVSGRVGGDTFDVLELDRDHLGFYIADAMGHGVPAGLLTIYVKKGIQPVESVGNSIVLRTPGTVLKLLNLDLMNQNVEANPFISMQYFVLNTETLILDSARGGHPPTLLIRNQQFQAIDPDGALLGVFDDVYETKRTQLQPGDKLIMFTDGIDAVTYRDHRVGEPSFQAAVLDLCHLPIQEMLRALYKTLFPKQVHEDDLTLLGVEISTSQTPPTNAAPIVAIPV